MNFLEILCGIQQPLNPAYERPGLWSLNRRCCDMVHWGPKFWQLWLFSLWGGVTAEHCFSQHWASCFQIDVLLCTLSTLSVPADLILAIPVRGDKDMADVTTAWTLIRDQCEGAGKCNGVSYCAGIKQTHLPASRGRVCSQGHRAALAWVTHGTGSHHPFALWNTIFQAAQIFVEPRRRQDVNIRIHIRDKTVARGQFVPFCSNLGALFSVSVWCQQWWFVTDLLRGCMEQVRALRRGVVNDLVHVSQESCGLRSSDNFHTLNYSWLVYFLH